MVADTARERLVLDEETTALARAIAEREGESPEAVLESALSLYARMLSDLAAPASEEIPSRRPLIEWLRDTSERGDVECASSFHRTVRELSARILAHLEASLHRMKVEDALRAAGLLAEPTDDVREWARKADKSLAEVTAALDKAGGPSLTELVLDQRGPRE